MTREITLSAILIVLVFACYKVIFAAPDVTSEKNIGINQLAATSKALNASIAQIEEDSTITFENKKKELEKAITEYQKEKKNYEDMVSRLPSQTTDSLMAIEENELKDIYNVDFLWTIVGNYATEEGIDLKFDIIKNITSSASLKNTSSKYMICDLKFIITGNYINLTDFIYDLEDDDRLNFEINDFEMQKEGDKLQVTLNIKGVKVNSENLIESSPNKAVDTSDLVQTIDGLISSDQKEKKDEKEDTTKKDKKTTELQDFKNVN